MNCLNIIMQMIQEEHISVLAAIAMLLDVLLSTTGQ